MEGKSVSGRRRRSAVGSPWHLVAEPARRRCRELHSQLTARVAVACGECWERAIRDDERAVVLFEVPREITPDPAYVDEIAVEQAVGGRRVRLTLAEQSAAVAVLARRGWTGNRIAEWLGLRPSRVVELRSAGPDAADTAEVA